MQKASPPKRPMPLNALRSFEAAARLGSFNAAAAELGVTPAAISLQVRRLEEVMERPLFVRGHRSVKLSEAGARLSPGLSSLFSRMEHLLAQTIGAENALLRVSAMPSFASEWLAPRLGRFTSANPEYAIRVAGEDKLITLDRDEADVGIRYGSGDYPGLLCEMIAPASATPVCSPQFAEKHAADLRHPVGLLGLPLLYDEIAEIAPGLPTWESWFEAASVKGCVPQGGPRFESLHLALTAAQRGQGIALGLTPLIDEDVAAGNLVRPFPITIRSRFSFWLVLKAERARERKIATFREWLHQETHRA